MITRKVISALYRKYPKPPRVMSDLKIEDFTATLGELYGITLDETCITFGKMEENNPFRSILLHSLCGIVYFEHHIAVITSTYILFFGREKYSVDVHFKPQSLSFFHRLREWFSRKGK